MNVIDVKVDKKIASLVDCNAYIVCDNEDYRLRFWFDEEWQSCGEKTAIFTSVGNGKKLTWERVFTGDAVDVPSFKDCEILDIGLACGSLRTTTSAHIRCLPSARTGTIDVTQSVEYALGYETGAYEVNRGVVELVGGTQTTGVGAVTEVNATFAEELIAKGVEVFAGETTIELVGKLPLIEQPVLERLGTEQESAFSAVQEINATLAETLVGKGVEADATETTEELVGKVSQIEDWVLSQTKALDFSGEQLYDETAIRHMPNLYCPRVTSISFNGNKRLETVGDVYAPKVVDTSIHLFGDTNIRRIGKLTVGAVGEYLFSNNKYLEEIEELNAPIVGSGRAVFNVCALLVKIGGALDFTSCTSMLDTFRNCYVLTEFRVVPNSINVDMSKAGLQNSPNLSYETLVSIKNGLADRTGQTQLTITLSSTSIAKYSDEDKREILLKNWLLK